MTRAARELVVLARARRARRSRTYAIDNHAADFGADDVVLDGSGARFTLVDRAFG